MVNSPEVRKALSQSPEWESPEKLPERACLEIKSRHVSAPQTWSSDEEPLVIDLKDDCHSSLHRSISPDLSVVKASSSQPSSTLGKAPSRKTWRGKTVLRIAMTNDASSPGSGSGGILENGDEHLLPCTLPLSVSDDDSPVVSTDRSSLLPTTIESEEFRPKPSGDADHESFWRYKTVPKGPQPVITFKVDASHPEKNPHKPFSFTDPVYDKSQPVMIQHGGRARTGEGNDITPNPRKLAKLGVDVELVKEKMASLGDSPKHKREKMRCSSRLCRLKRLANHEANKIKLSGLEKEREELSSVITRMNHRMKGPSTLEGSCLSYLEYLKAETLTEPIAGYTSNYVNSVIQSRPLHYYTDSDSDD